MKFSRLLVLAFLVIATIITCVACNAEETTTRKRTTKKNDAPTACDNGEHNVPDDAWVVEREASCRVPLKEVGVCADCGEEVERKGEKLDHSWGEDITEPATCLQVGQVYHKCAICNEEEMIEELPIAEHNFTTHTDTTGKYVKYECPDCSTMYIKAKANDLFCWATNEVDYSALGIFDDNFGISLTSLQLYTAAGSNNTVCAMAEGRNNCYMFVSDNNNILKNEDNIVIQFDVMYEAFPTGGVQSLLCLPHDLESNGSYVGLLYVNSDGYLGFVDERCYETPIKDGQLELNTWHNIAVVLHLEDVYKATVQDLHDKGVTGATEDETFYRLPYEIYLDGEKLDLKAEVAKKDANGNDIEGQTEEYHTELGGAGWGTLAVSEITALSVRIGEGGKRQGGTVAYDMSLDNFRIYSGTTVQPALRGTLDFGAGGKITVDYPPVIDWENTNSAQ